MGKKKIKKTQEEALGDLKRIYGNLYDYSKMVYTTAHGKVTLVCKEHGDFSVSFTNLISLRTGKYPGCSTCCLNARGIKRRKPKEDFLTEAAKVHGDKYTYNLDTYTTRDKKMEIVCGEHGVFLQSPEKHLYGRTCPYCSGHARVTSDVFLKRVLEIHGNKYSYNPYDLQEINIKGIEAFININCKDHGWFRQKVNNHLNGAGCKACAEYGFNTGKPAIVYVLLSHCKNVVKVGITNRDVNTRLKEINKKSPFIFSVIDTFKFDIGKNALDIETNILRIFSKNMATVEEVFSGSTECFYIDGFNYLHTILEEISNHNKEASDE